MPPLGLALKQLVPQQNPFVVPRDLFFNSTSGKIWIADQKVSLLPSFDATLRRSSLIVDLSALYTGSRRVIGDGTNLYVSSAQSTTNANLIAIISQATGKVVGLCDVGAGIQARDQTLDGAGNIFVVGRVSGNAPISTIQKFNIAAALASYPVPVVATVTTPVHRGYHVCAFDPVTGTLFGGTYYSLSVTSTLVKLNAATLAEISHADFTAGASSVSHFHFLLAAAGSIWASTLEASFIGHVGNLMRVNPTTFPAGGSIVFIATSSVSASALSYDATGNTILVGDESSPGGGVSRVSVGTNLLVSTIAPPNDLNSSAVAAGGAIWITSNDPVPGPPGVFLYTSGIGTETEIEEITTF